MIFVEEFSDDPDPAGRSSGAAGGGGTFGYYFPHAAASPAEPATWADLLDFANGYRCSGRFAPSPWFDFDDLIRSDVALPFTRDLRICSSVLALQGRCRKTGAAIRPLTRRRILDGLHNIRRGPLHLSILDDPPGSTRPSEPLRRAMTSLLHRLAALLWDQAENQSGRAARFRRARQQLRWIYQWLVVNHYLPAVCGIETVREIRRARAPLYGWFLHEGGAIPTRVLPVPLEFIVPDWAGLLALASGAAVNPSVVRCNLLTGQVFNLPSAQALIEEVSAVTGIRLPELDPDMIGRPPPGWTSVPRRFQSETPLWFYALQEARHFGQGRVFGPLGGLIVASTLVGLVASDRQSYWNAVTDADAPGDWRPGDIGELVPETLEALLEQDH